MRTTIVVLLLLWGATAFAQSSARDRRQAVEYLKLGQDLLRNEQFEKAGEAFTASVKLDPLLELAHYGVGQVAMATKQYPAAIKAYTACRDAFLNNAAESLSDTAIAEQRIQDQIRQLQDTVLALTRGRVSTQNKDVTIGRLTGQIRELESRRHQTPGTAPQTPTWISIALGSAYFRTDAMVEAEAAYREALQVDPTLGEGHNNLAVVLMLTGRYDEADREVKAAEEHGFRVSSQFKADLKKRKGGGGGL